MDKVGRLKDLIQRMSEAPILQKGAIAEKALNQALDVIETQEVRLGRLEDYVMGVESWREGLAGRVDKLEGSGGVNGE
ncbi:MAG: hypothetical protein AB2687_00530 [Candidatus Thiodiazotropha taylori]